MHYRMKIYASLILAMACCVESAAVKAAEVAFRRHVINPESQFSACAVIDVNRDGRLDIFCGGFWYEAPTWRRHTTREVPMIRGRFDDYSNQSVDVNQDGWTDIVSINYRSKSLFWIEHPGASLGTWRTHLIDTPGASETGRLVEIDGDGQLDVLPNGTDFASWYRFENDGNGGIDWIRHALPQELIGHGLGAGDIDGDGRTDLISTRGWARAPRDPRRERWRWHGEFQMHRDGSIPILVHDVDRDGDADLIWGRGHNIGLYWMQQHTNDGQRTWQMHAIDTSWSEAHSIELADIDGDGAQDLVAGKRYLGHDGKDPGEFDPLVVYWYDFDTQLHSWQRHDVSFGGTCGFDLDPKCADLDQDGDVDIVAATRGGLYLLENLLGDNDVAARSESLTPQVPVYRDRANLLSLQDSDGNQQSLETGFDWGLRRWQILRNMERVMGPLPAPHRRVPLQMKVESEQDAGKYKRLKITYTVEPGDRVPAFLLMPKVLKRKTPAVLCLHPTSPLGKAQICGLGGKPSRFYAHELAERGFICLAPDYPSFGDYDYDFNATADKYVSGTMKAIWNNVRSLDLLETLPEVDRDRIGCIGHSLGGHNGLFTAAFDQRIRAVVTSCGFNAFASYYGGDLKGWSSDRYMPRIRSQFELSPERMPFDFHEVLAAMSPRPVFINAPLRDSNFAVVGVREAVAAAERVYKFHGKPDRLKVVYPEAEHDFPDDVRQEVYVWLEEQLKR